MSKSCTRSGCARARKAPASRVRSARRIGVSLMFQRYLCKRVFASIPLHSRSRGRRARATYAGTMTDAATNPLLAPSPLPFDLPDYPNIRPEHYLPAFEQAFASHRAEIDAIATSSDAPTFENTLVALE